MNCHRIDHSFYDAAVLGVSVLGLHLTTKGQTPAHYAAALA